jgi:hypothetical protein
MELAVSGGLEVGVKLFEEVVVDEVCPCESLPESVIQPLRAVERTIPVVARTPRRFITGPSVVL